VASNDVERPAWPFGADSSAIESVLGGVRDYAIFLLDAQGRILTWNAGAHAIKGYERSEVIGRHISLFYTPEDATARRPERLLRVAAEEGRVEDEGWRVRKDGTRFWADVVITAIRDESGAVVGYSKVTRDLTERVAAEHRLRLSEERLRLMIASVQDYAIFAMDEHGYVSSWNRGAERITGYTADEIIGRHFSVFYPPIDIVRGKPERELAIARSRGSVEDEDQRVRKDGTTYVANVVISAIRDDRGELVGFTKVTRDLSEQQRMQRDLARTALDRARAEEAVKERDVVLSIAAHELRTPITAFRLKLEGIAKVVESKLQGRIAGEIIGSRVKDALRQVDRINDLVERLLDVSRGANRSLDIRYEELDLASLVATAVEDQEDDARHHEVVLSVRSTGDCVGSWDRRGMEQVVVNLVSNAIKYGDGKPVDVAVEGTTDKVRIAVVDHGIGIGSADLERIFHPFERAAPAHHFPGLGLGLFVARRIVEGHGGHLDVTSDVATGTRFTVVLPKAQQ
jgi:PAS domain S-box-containing protein